jgi:hypothetical protein
MDHVAVNHQAEARLEEAKRRVEEPYHNYPGIVDILSIPW